ncbi:MAG TPA: inositol monophosphatase family protein [Gemmatimonadaceae bacterium]|nr:inositol monophosphatase family protein [Gemmatimonadaceae bacterium]
MTFAQGRERRNASQAAPRDAWLRICVEAAGAAAGVIRDGGARLTELTWTEKSAADFVSDIDVAAEGRIREVLEQHEPGATILGEELSPGAATDALTFVVDPLDGTTNFLHGYPVYSVSIAAMVDGVLQAGVVLDVPRNVTFTATRDGGAFRDGSPIAVSRETLPGRALVGTGFPFKHRQHITPFLAQFAAVMSTTAGVRRAGSAALDLADVACGRFDAFWELMLAPWDIAAGMLLVREAGGVVTDLDGAEAPVDHTALVAGGPAMHAWLLDTLRAADGRATPLPEPQA